MNFSTTETRNEGGFDLIMKDHLPKLKDKHHDHILLYGEGNEKRLVGKFETARIDEFTYAVGHRGTSVRVPLACKLKNKGFYEDRRPAANVDPYLCTSIMLDTTCLKSKYNQNILTAFKRFKGLIK